MSALLSSLPALVEALPSQPAASPEGLFSRERQVEFLHALAATGAVRAAAGRAGLGGKVTPHVLRHCYATHAHEAGAPVRNLQEAMGHTQIETTMRYLTPSAAGVRSPLDALA